MKVEDYEYVEDDEFEHDELLTDERKEIIINETKDQIVRESIALHKILRICKNEEELDFIYKWLTEKGITIRGINTSLNQELEKYEQIKRLGKVELPKPLEEEEQLRLFIELNNMQKSGIDTNSKEYEDIRQKLIVHNMRLALWAVTVKYGKSLQNFKIEEDDLKEIALESLIESVDKFDASYGYKFSTYAVPMVYYAVKRRWREEINHSEAKRIDWKRLEELEEKMLKSENRMPTDEEIKEELGIGDESLKNLKQYIGYHLREYFESPTEYYEEELINDLIDDERIEEIGSKPILNGVYIDEEGDAVQEDTRKVDIEGQIPIIKEEIKNMLNDDSLKDREKRILELRFGLKDGRERTLEEVRT